MSAWFDALRNRLFRWQSDGNVPIVLGQRRIFILPTRTGLLYALTLIVMLLGAINYDLGLGHALVFLLVGLGLTAMVHTFRNLLGLQIQAGRPEAVFAGEMAHFPLHLGHDRPQPRLALEFTTGKHPGVSCHLEPRGRIRIDLPVPAERRGWMELPRIRLSTRFPLGLFVAWSYPQPAMRCLVYPRPIELPLPPDQPCASIGMRHGDGGEEDFAGLRPHQPADSPRHIAWKAAARGSPAQPLLVKQFAGGAQRELWLDWNALPREMVPETRLSAMTGWVLAADAAGLRYGLTLPGTRIDLAEGPIHRQRCLEQLALATP